MTYAKKKKQHFTYDRVRMQADGRTGTCGKLCFVSRKKADAAIKSVRTSGSDTNFKTTVFESYFCTKCDCYHIGHNRYVQDSRV